MKVAFIGLGYAARSLHLPAVRSFPGSRVAGGADPSPDRRVGWRRLDAGPVFEDASQLLESARPDVVVVSTPPDSHAAWCVESLEAGAHVICEKPFVETLDQVELVLAASRRAGRAVVVNHQFRYMPIFAAIPPLLGAPGVGRPVFLQFTQLMDFPPWEEPVAWRAAMTDRVLFEAGVHIVDLMLMMLGRLPGSVFAATSAGLDPARSADAMSVVTMDFGDGVLAQITINRLCRSGTRYLDLRLDCEEASIRSSMGGRALVRMGKKRAERTGLRIDFGIGGLAWIERGHRRRVMARNPRHADRKATAALYREALAAITRGDEPPTTGHVAADALRVIDAAYRSARAGERVTLDTGPTFT